MMGIGIGTWIAGVAFYLVVFLGLPAARILAESLIYLFVYAVP
jgi:hypothetical protein